MFPVLLRFRITFPIVKKISFTAKAYKITYLQRTVGGIEVKLHIL